MSVSDTNLAALIGSRICHDLISPIGAINNGLELLQMSGDSKGPEIGLIGESVGSASARIRFFRIAFGAAGDQMVGRGEVAAILRDLYEGSRLSVIWDCDSPQPRTAVRMAFLAVLCMETALPYGGVIHISTREGRWKIEGTAERIGENDRLWSLLDSIPAKEDLAPAHVQFALLPLIAAEDGRRLGRALTNEAVTLTF